MISFQFYLVMKGHGKNEDTSLTSKNGPGKFVAAKIRAAHTSLSQQSNPQNTTNLASDGSKLTDKDVQVNDPEYGPSLLTSWSQGKMSRVRTLVSVKTSPYDARTMI